MDRRAAFAAARAQQLLGVIPSRCAHLIRLGGHLAGLARRISLTIALEDGSTRLVEIAADDGHHGEAVAADGRRVEIRDVVLPPLPLGRHRIWAEDAPESPAHLAIVHDRAFLPEALRGDARFFGVAAQLYSLRREPVEGLGDQGIGDFTTLRLLAEEAAAAGAVTVGLNPLHALFASDPERASPYHPSDRRFLDPLAIDVFNLPEPLLTARTRVAVEQALPEASRLSAKPFVDYAAAAALKSELFDAAHAAFRDLVRNRPSDPLVEDFESFVRAGGEALRRFSIFSAIEASHGCTLRKFPEPLKSPSGEGVAAFAAAQEGSISRAMFLQWLADR